MKKIYTFLILLLSSVSTIQAQWVDQLSPVFVNNRLWSVQVIDANTVWAVNADTYTVIKTNNGGLTWNTLPVNDPAFSGFYVGSVAAIDANTAWLTASTGVSPIKSRIYKTTDGGTTWQHQNTAYANPGVNGQWAFANHFFDANNGVNIGELHVPNATNPGSTSYMEILTTSNGGQTWQVVPAGNMPPHPGYSIGVFYRAFSVVGNTIWFMTMQGKVYKSVNKGLNWTVSETNFPSPAGTSYSIAFSDANNGLATNGNHLLKTTDGGTTWTNANATGKWYGYELAYIPGTAGTFISSGNKTNDPGSSISTDNGNTWTILEATNRHWDMHFINPTTGWSGGLGKMMKFGSLTTGTSENLKSASFLISPNPGKGIINISTASEKAFKLEVYDLVGNKIKNSNEGYLSKSTLNLSGQSTGIYMLHILSGENRYIEKIVLQ